MKSAYFFCGTLLAAQPVLAAFPQLYPLILGGHTLNVELAVTLTEQEKGLMFRRELPADRGMLFVFKTADKYCMWMKNTFIPLDVAFIGAGGIVINIERMQPLSENLHCAKGDARYALEAVPQWFDRAGIKAGSTISQFEEKINGYLSSK
jgi:hypothetical protein